MEKGGLSAIIAKREVSILTKERNSHVQRQYANVTIVSK